MLTTPPAPLVAKAPAPAGWYPDPRSDGMYRYWDGSTWTQRTSAVAEPAGWPVELVQVRRKSVLVALLLTLVFGPVGLIYVTGRTLPSSLMVLALVLGVFSTALAPFIWVGSMIYGPLAAASINARADRIQQCLGVALPGTESDLSRARRA